MLLHRKLLNSLYAYLPQKRFSQLFYLKQHLPQLISSISIHRLFTRRIQRPLSPGLGLDILHHIPISSWGLSTTCVLNKSRFSHVLSVLLSQPKHILPGSHSSACGHSGTQHKILAELTHCHRALSPGGCIISKSFAEPS